MNDSDISLTLIVTNCYWHCSVWLSL